MFTTEPSLSQRIERMIADCPIVDPLASVPGLPSGATSLAALLASLPLAATGQPASDRDPSLGDDEVVRRALPYLDRLRHTSAGWCFFRILRDLYGVYENRLDTSNIDAVLERNRAAEGDSNWASDVLARANLVVVANRATSQPVTPGVQWLDASRLPTPGALEGEPAGGLSPTLALDAGREHAARMLAAGASHAFFRVNARFDRFDTSGLEAPFPLEVFDALQQFRRAAVIEVQKVADIGAVERTLLRYPDLRVGILVSSCDAVERVALREPTQELARRHDHAVLLGHDEPEFVATAIRDTILDRLQRIPSSKIAVFASRATTPEWAYARFQLVRKATAAALADMVSAGYHEEHDLPRLLGSLFHDTPNALLGLDAATAPAR